MPPTRGKTGLQRALECVNARIVAASARGDHAGAVALLRHRAAVQRAAAVSDSGPGRLRRTHPALLELGPDDAPWDNPIPC
eukprot:gene5893-40827_t